jgi:hypothetical protein
LLVSARNTEAIPCKQRYPSHMSNDEQQVVGVRAQSINVVAHCSLHEVKGHFQQQHSSTALGIHV